MACFMISKYSLILKLFVPFLCQTGYVSVLDNLTVVELVAFGDRLLFTPGIYSGDGVFKEEFAILFPFFFFFFFLLAVVVVVVIHYFTKSWVT